MEYNYNDILKEIETKSSNYVNSISLLYFDETDIIRKHSYFREHSYELVDILTNLDFLFTLSNKTLINVMDSFKKSPKDYDTLSKISINMGDILQKKEKHMEKINTFYKELKDIIKK